MSGLDGAIAHPARPARRGAARATTWWGKAWVRGAEEAAYDVRDLKRARVLSRSGNLGQITVASGHLIAAVLDQGEWRTVEVTLPVLDDASSEALVEVVAAEAGRIASLMAGDLPHLLVEHAEESGVELLPFGGEWGATCTCDGWVDPCAHALALLYQVTWLVETDPFVLLHLRGLSRHDLLARLHSRTVDAVEVTEEDPTVEVAIDAAMRAQRILDTMDDPDAGVEHLF